SIQLVLLCALAAASLSCSNQQRSEPAAGSLPRPVPMTSTPSDALAICRRLALVGPSCPRLVPIGPFARAKRPPGYRGVAARAAIAQCMSKRGRGVPITSRACRFQSWGLEAGAPAGLPADAPAGLPGKRLGYRGTRPPHYVHI